MQLPELHDWAPTRQALHSAAIVAGVIRKAYAEHDPHTFLHLALTPMPGGLSTGTFESFGELRVDFGGARLAHYAPNGSPHSIPIAHHSTASLADALLKGLALRGLNPAIARERVEDSQSLWPNPQHAAEYADALDLIHSALRAHMSLLAGLKTGPVVWPHGFDLSALWFPGGQPDEQGAHINFGFSPASNGFERPYAYIYAYPYPVNFQPPTLPAPLKWNAGEGGWTGARIDYDDLRQLDDPAGALAEGYHAAYAAFAGLLN